MSRALPSPAVVRALESTYRREGGQLLASLIRSLGDFDRAEDALGEACAEALDAWTRGGVPTRPAAWLATVARRKALEALRRDARRCTDAGEPLARDPIDELERNLDSPIQDERLRLIFTCCHPALALEARIALTLRSLCGLRPAEIASAFLIPEATLEQRLVRARRKIREAGIPYRVPLGEQLPERLEAVLRVLYLIFNEGYDASSGDSLVRGELCDEAIRLARLVTAALPESVDARGLLALMLLQDSRRDARIGPEGELILLPDQDRSRWDPERRAEGLHLVESALRAGPPGPYALQAAIAGCHARARTADETDWDEIVALYGLLARAAPSPVVELNRAAALAMARGPAAGLELVERLERDGALAGYSYLHALRADLLRRLGRRAEAVRAYRHALERTANEAERSFLDKRLTELES